MASLFLIDGHNVLYRTFFGVPRLSAPDGTPTNVVLGVARILLKILREERPEAIVAVFDSREPTERHALFPEYKANRLKAPEDLSVQIPIVEEVIDALGVPSVSVAGVEADDIIGTLSLQAQQRGMDVVIVSSDKDLYQLVSSRVKVRDGLKEHTVGEAQVEEAFGVPPGKVPDVLALAGDPSDNVPGVPGIGEKTASQWIREFGSLDALLDHTDRLKGAKREKVEKNADVARLCRKLVTINREVPVPGGLSEFAPRGIDAARIVPLFRRLGFRKLLDDLDLGREELAGGFRGPGAGICWRSAGSAGEFLDALGPGKISAAGLAFGEGSEAMVAISVEGGGIHLLPGGEAMAAARGLCARGATLRLHDGKTLYRHGGAAGAQEDLDLFDTQVAGYLLDPEGGTPAFGKLRARYLPDPPAAQEGDTPEARAAIRGSELLVLGKVLEERLSEAGLLDVFREIDMPLLPVLHRMEERGIRIDPAIFADLSRELDGEIASIEQKVAAAAGTDFNINSPKQLAALLFGKLQLPSVKKTKTGYSTDVEVLERLKDLHEIPALVLEYRTLAKIRSTYVDVLPKMVDPRDGRIHTTFHQTQAATGRLSSADPNLQNIPIRTELGRRIRSGFVAEQGNVFIGADYSQVELRLLAHLSGDAELVRRFREGDDIHRATAAAVFGVDAEDVTPEQRRRAKVINFGILYGMSPYGLSRELGIGGSEAKAYIGQYFERYPGVREYLGGLKERARRDGFVQTLMGRRRYLKDIDSRNRVLREAAERVAVNSPIQGSAADLIKIAMIRVDREFRRSALQARLILQVHDELIVEAPEGEAAASERILTMSMEGAANLSVPLTVSVSRGRNWGEIH